MPKFSIIVGFRNRNIQRVKNSLNSLANQIEKDFELIFVDYGSDEEVSKEVQLVVESYPFAKYVFNNTRGWFWNRAHALNTGIKIAQGELIVLWDIDLIVENNFLEELLKNDFSKEFTTHRCWYLPEQATIDNFKTERIIKKSQHNYVGLACIKKTVLEDIYGFDEFYQVWGAEDDDLYKRLERYGLKRKMINADQIPIYHQWHTTQAPDLPDLWYLEMVNYLYNPQKDKADVYGKIYTEDERFAFQKFFNNKIETCINLNLELYNKTLIYNNIIKIFYEITDSGCVAIKMKFPYVELHAFTKKIINRFNKFMLRLNRNFRLYNKVEKESEELRQNVYSFLKYFIGKNREQLKDYYLDWNENGFSLILEK